MIELIPRSISVSIEVNLTDAIKGVQHVLSILRGQRDCILLLAFHHDSLKAQQGHLLALGLGIGRF